MIVSAENREDRAGALRRTGTVRPGQLVLAVLVGCLLFLTFAATSARAGQTHVFLEDFGSVAQPMFGEVVALGVDQDTGDVLVYDRAAGTLSRFNPDGTPNIFSALGTHIISGLQTEGAADIAVDESGTATDGNIYVAQARDHEVKVFSNNGESLGQITAAGTRSFSDTEFLSPCGVAVGPGGELYVGEGEVGGTINKFEPTGAVPVDSDYVPSESFAANYPCNLALGSGPTAGFIFSVYISRGSKYDLASGALAYQFGRPEAQALAVDPTSGHVLLAEPKTVSEVIEFDASGSAALPVAKFSDSFSALAVDASTGRIIASNGEGKLKLYSPLVPLPDVETKATTPLSPTSLRFNGSVNPVGAPVTECFFQYGPTAAYGAQASCESPDASELGAGNTAVGVHADIGALAPESVYHYRLVAKNANGQVVSGDSTTKTPSKPVVGVQWASDVGFTEATVHAKIGPENAATEYWVEWGPTAAYGQQTEPLTLPADTEVHSVSAVLNGLQPGSTYHFRFVAANAQGTVQGADRTLVTYRIEGTAESCPNEAFRSGFSATLPDCRALEMVSPLDKANGDVFALGNINGIPVRLNQVALDGESLAYSSFRSFPGSSAAPFTSEYIARRSNTGWANEALAPAQDEFGPFNNVTSANNNFKAFTPDLCHTWLVHAAPPNLAPGAVDDFGNLYRRANCTSPSSYEALTTVTPPGFVPHELRLEELPELLGYSGDGRSAVFRLAWKLTDEGLEKIGTERAYQTYEVRDGVVKFVCILPNGTPTKDYCTAGSGASPGAGSESTFMNLGASVSHAMSNDGSRIYWSATERQFSPAGKIYVRVNGAETFSVSGAQTSAPSQFLGASRDGDFALFRVMEGTKKDKLFKYSLATNTSTEMAGKVLGVAGASDDLEYVYFVSSEALGAPGNQGAAGEPNLYLTHDGTTTFIATLASKDTETDLGTEVPNNVSPRPIYHAARATPDGRHLVFISARPLTGEDNVDGAAGEVVSEVFRYDSDAGSISCVSCNPSGSAFGRVVQTAGGGGTLRISGTVPVAQNQLYTPRAQSDDGSRVFFTSYASLIPEDEDQDADVYQWSDVGVGSCAEANAAYSPVNDGCLFLISVGDGARDVEFVDSSPSGRDVFFATEDSLLRRDRGAIDIYDARIGGGFPEPPPVVPCDPSQGGCQTRGQVQGAQSPGSTAVTEGNVPARRCPKGTRKVTRKGKVRCIKTKPKRSKRNGQKHRQKAKEHKSGGAGR